MINNFNHFILCIGTTRKRYMYNIRRGYFELNGVSYNIKTTHAVTKQRKFPHDFWGFKSKSKKVKKLHATLSLAGKVPKGVISSVSACFNDTDYVLYRAWLISAFRTLTSDPIKGKEYKWQE